MTNGGNMAVGLLNGALLSILLWMSLLGWLQLIF